MSELLSLLREIEEEAGSLHDSNAKWGNAVRDPAHLIAEYAHKAEDAAAVLIAEWDRMNAALEDIAFWEGGPKPPHKGFDFDSHLDCTAKECPAMKARAALAPGTPVDR